MGKPTATDESRRIAAAFRSNAALKKARVAAQVGVSAAMVSQWVHGVRPVPARFARPLADALGVTDPRTISAAYAQVANEEPENVLNMPGSPALRPGLEKSRIENDVDALRYVVSALVNAMIVHRPTEAKDVAEGIRGLVPAKYLDQGFVGAELAKLERHVGQPKAAVPAASRRRAKR